MTLIFDTTSPSIAETTIPTMDSPALLHCSISSLTAVIAKYLLTSILGRHEHSPDFLHL